MTLAVDPHIRALVTPEGVDLRVRIASMSERAGALIIDLLIIVLILIVVTLVILGFAAATRLQGAGEAAQIVWMLGAFVLRNFYFTAFEASPRAATPGKRAMGLRVAARNGGALRVDQVVARNVMRELELYLPIGFLLARGEDIDAVIILCGIIWCAMFVLFPLFNRDRLRLGDIIAGTWVLRTPKQVLLPDMAGASGEGFAFTDPHLSAYGVKELQVLEAVLRTSEPQAMAAVAERIRAKISWRKAAMEEDHAFLRAYYTALRRHLEQRLLFGVRKRDKHDQA